MHLSRSLRPLSAGLVLVALAAVTAVGVARAAQSVRPAEVSVPKLRSLADHYRVVTWDFQRAAKVQRTPTSYSYRRSSDHGYLRWTVDAWTRHAYSARQQALLRLHRRLAVALPPAPALRAPLYRRVVYSRQLALRLRKIYPGTVTRAFANARARTDSATLRLWQRRSAEAALAVALHGSREIRQPSIPAWLAEAFLCIHRYEGAWDSNTGNGYFGGLQMDVGFMRSYGPEYVQRWGTADNWPVWAQLQTAVRAHESGRGFTPWPNTARACGLL
jgi:hypothetical protein